MSRDLADEFFYILCCRDRLEPKEKPIQKEISVISYDQKSNGHLTNVVNKPPEPRIFVVPPQIRPPPHYRLLYFDIRGLGEPIRMMFHYYGVPFEDVRISQEKWKDLKESTRIGKLPELDVDGFHLAQSMTIARFLAEKFGVYANMDEEAAALQRARVDEIADTQKDLTHELAVYVGTALGMRDGKKGIFGFKKTYILSVLKRNVYKPTIAKYFVYYLRLLDDSRSGFLAGDKPSWIDFFVEEYLTTLTNVDNTALSENSQLIDFVHQIRTLPRLVDYIERRKETII